MTAIVVDLAVETVTAEAFAPFGMMIAPNNDGTPASLQQTPLDLSQGVPRFYTMRLPAPGLDIRGITRHQRVTQVLASAGGRDWYLGVAAPGELVTAHGEPELDRIHGFHIPGDIAVQLHLGTWHAGPLFEGEPAAFFNLELTNTNDVDHDSCELTRDHDVTLRLQAQ